MKAISLKQRENTAGNINQPKNKVKTVKASTGRNALVRKELADHLKSKRFLILLLLIGCTSFASLYGAISGLSDAIQSDSNFIFLKLYTSSGSSIPSFMSFIALLGPIVGLALGFDAVNSERSNGTLNRLVSQPIYRDAIIVGKFLAGTIVIAIVIFSMGIALGAVGMAATGLVPDVEEVLRILIFLFFTVVYRFLAGNVDPVFCHLPPFCDLSACVDFRMDFLCDFYEPCGKYRRKCGLSG